MAKNDLVDAGFPVPLDNRICYGIAAALWGGRDVEQKAWPDGMLKGYPSLRAGCKVLWTRMSTET